LNDKLEDQYSKLFPNVARAREKELTGFYDRNPFSTGPLYDALPDLAKFASGGILAKAGATAAELGNIVSGGARLAEGEPPAPTPFPADLGNTLDRINRGQPYPWRNDGSVFRNDQGRLPEQPPGYYTEYVHPTPGISGPGAQRVVTGANGEIYYTPDHYSNFYRIPR
jgi:filamentous hemagglutinin